MSSLTVSPFFLRPQKRLLSMELDPSALVTPGLVALAGIVKLIIDRFSKKDITFKRP